MRVPVAPLAAVLAALPALAAAAARPAYGGEVVVALPASPREPDPARAADPAELLAARALHATPLEIDAAGALSPGLLAEVPVPEAGGRTFRLRLREGLRFADGSPLTARHLAGSLSRLAAPGAPNGWIVLPVAGAGALDGSEAAGIQVLSDREVRIDLDLALPEFPWALAALPAAVVSPRGVGAGPFRPAGSLAPHDGRLLLAANEAHHRGRPFADRAVLLVRPPRGLAEEVARGDVHLALRAEALSPGAVPLRPAVATYAAVNGRTLGALAVRVRSALAAIDRAELVRRFVRGPSEPLAALLPPWQHAAAPSPRPSPPRSGGEGEEGGATPSPRSSPPQGGGEGGVRARPILLLVPTGAPDARAAADRIQVKLFDAGLRASVEEADPLRFWARLSAGEHDVAIVPIVLLAARPSLAAAQIAWAVGGPAEARRALEAMAGLSGEASLHAAEGVASRLGLVPLFASGLRASPGPALRGVSPTPDGTLDPGDLWLFQGGATP